MISRDTVWTIPQGQEFTANLDGKQGKYVADEDLIIMYKGKLLELQEEANERSFAVSPKENKGGVFSFVQDIVDLIKKLKK